MPRLLTGGAFLGFLGGVSFSLAMSVVFRNRRLENLRTSMFIIAGAVVTGIMPVAFNLPRWLRGGGSPLWLLSMDVGIASILGGSTAYGMLTLARAAPEPPPSLQPPEVPDRMNIRPERPPLTALQAEVTRRSGTPSPSTSPMPVTSNPSVSPMTLPVIFRSRRPSRPE